jgi:chromosomal replication initiation ATPase DnaA
MVSAMMTIERAAHVLRKYNDYRRLDHEPCDPPFTATEIGQAIDVAADLLEGCIVKANIESIIRAVVRETGVTEAEMCNRGRQREFAEARAIVSWLAYHYTPMTLTAIGQRLGRDHATAIYYNKTVSTWLYDKRTNPRGRSITMKLMEELDNDTRVSSTDRTADGL